MDYGHLERVEHDTRPTVFMGEINMPGVTGDVCLVPRTRKFKDTSPDYDVKLQVPGRDWVIVGAAWTKQFKDGSGEFFSLTFDHTGLSQPIYCAAFPDDDDLQPKEADQPINYTITWGRGKKQAPVPSDPVMSTDSIPY